MTSAQVPGTGLHEATNGTPPASSGSEPIVALNPDDGSYKWHFQNSPHDVWDYDGVNEPVLVNCTL